jgi:hypothetical protein
MIEIEQAKPEWNSKNANGYAASRSAADDIEFIIDMKPGMTR